MPLVRRLNARPDLVARCALETYSVLTSMPVPHRALAVLAVSKAMFPRPYPRLPAAAIAAAATAGHVGAVLISCDRGAVSIYEKYGVGIQLL
jgi:hypothetical protein